jgi:DNA-binding HxlR family transcriptional regulator
MSTAPPQKRYPYNQWAPDARALDMVGDKWTLLIVRDLATGPRRFVELQRTLPGISTEQLRSRLNRMVADGLLTRERYREVPPRVDYELTEKARDLLRVVGELARWGSRWAWGGPEVDEAIDIGAILRSASGLTHAACLQGAIQAAVFHPDGTRQEYGLRFDEGHVTIEEHGLADADASVEGSREAWVHAFSPEGTLAELQLGGDKVLAEKLLRALAPANCAEAQAN